MNRIYISSPPIPRYVCCGTALPFIGTAIDLVIVWKREQVLKERVCKSGIKGDPQGRWP
jgi:hypothetical protein